MTNKTAPTTTEATPATADAPLLPAPVTVDGPNQPAALKTTADDHTVPTESTTSPTWTDTAKSILPAGAAAYLRTSIWISCDIITDRPLPQHQPLALPPPPRKRFLLQHKMWPAPRAFLP